MHALRLQVANIENRSNYPEARELFASWKRSPNTALVDPEDEGPELLRDKLLAEPSMHKPQELHAWGRKFMWRNARMHRSKANL